MRVLFLSNTPFLPPAAGNRARIEQMVAYLAAGGHEVAMLMLPAVDRPEWDVDGMRAQLAWLEIVQDGDTPPAWRRTASRLATVAERLTGRDARPIGVDAWCPPAFRARVRARVGDWRPDVVVAEYVFLSACLDGLATVHPCVTVVDTHDLMHRRWAVYDAVGMAPQWFHTTYDEERRGLARADVVLAIQEEEAKVLRTMLPGRCVLTVPHARRVSPAPPELARPQRLLLVSSYNEHNVHALGWLTGAVWPALRKAVPHVELVVCGTIAQKVGPMPPGVVVRGFVADLAAEYAAARVIVNPRPAGTGIAVKLVDALCHGRPVVTTPAGAAGVDAGEAEGVVVAETAEEFAAALCRILAQPVLWQRLVAAAVAQAARRFSPDAAFAPLVDHLARALGQRPS